MPVPFYNWNDRSTPLNTIQINGVNGTLDVNSNTYNMESPVPIYKNIFKDSDGRYKPLILNFSTYNTNYTFSFTSMNYNKLISGEVARIKVEGKGDYVNDLVAYGYNTNMNITNAYEAQIDNGILKFNPD